MPWGWFLRRRQRGRQAGEPRADEAGRHLRRIQAQQAQVDDLARRATALQDRNGFAMAWEQALGGN